MCIYLVALYTTDHLHEVSSIQINEEKPEVRLTKTQVVAKTFQVHVRDTHVYTTQVLGYHPLTHTRPIPWHLKLKPLKSRFPETYCKLLCLDLTPTPCTRLPINRNCIQHPIYTIKDLTYLGWASIIRKMIFVG